MNTTVKLENKFCEVEIDTERKQITVRDLVDMNNEPCAYSKTKRGIEKVWLQIVTAFGDDMRMSDVTKIFSDSGIRYHYWCAVD